jgi:hypothetical protein
MLKKPESLVSAATVLILLNYSLDSILSESKIFLCGIPALQDIPSSLYIVFFELLKNSSPFVQIMFF